MKNIVILCLTCSVFVGCGDKNSSSGYNYLSQYNVVWDSPSKNASGSMPIGGGDIGGNVWVEDGNLYMYLQRSGSFCENGEYLKLGRYRFTLTPNPFDSYREFKQTLHLTDGYVSVKAHNDEVSTNIKVWVDITNHSVHVTVDSDKKTDLKVTYENWRTVDREVPPNERHTIFSLDAYPGKVWKAKDTIRYEGNSILFYHRNPKEPFAHSLMLVQQEVEAYKDEITNANSNLTFGGVVFGENLIPGKTDEGVLYETPYKSWSLMSEKPSKNYHVIVATHNEQASTIDEWEKNLQANIRGLDRKSGNFKKNVAWWNQFWNRSWVIVDPQQKESDPRIWQSGRNYQLTRYQLGGNLYGEFPTKFNGGSITFDPVFVFEDRKFDPDYRTWGGDVHTAQNQRLLYWPMLKSGDFDGMKSEFNLFEWGLPGAKAKVKTVFGHRGAMFCEYVNAAGLEIASGWGWDTDDRRGRGVEIPFGDPRADGAQSYNSFVEKGMMANGSIAYHWIAQVEHAYMMLEYHRFTGQNIDRYMPFIKESLIFFDEHYQARQRIRNGQSFDESGKLVFSPSTALETYRGAKNPVCLLSGIRTCLESLLRLESDSLSATDKKYFKEYLDRLPSGVYYETLADNSLIIKPAESYIAIRNQEAPQFYPLFPFDRFDLKSKEMEIFRNTYKKDNTIVKGREQSWHQDGIQLARMGMTNEAFEYNMKKLKDTPLYRFPTFWGPNRHDWDPDHNWGGSGMIGLQEMLMQTVGDNIYILPAWPQGKDVYFKLHAPYNTTVEVEYLDGNIKKLIIIPESRKKDVEVLIPNVN